MVIGEAQILGQVKEAYATARAVGAVRGQLDQLFSRAFAVAKRVRGETAVGSSSVSIASVAVELAERIFGTLEGKTVFIVGAGKMSELAARHLMAHGCAAIFVSNRTFERAVGLAEKFNGQAIKFDDLYNSCDRADIVITSTGSPHAIFRREHGEQFLARRKNRPMFFIDIAVPRDVSPEMGKLDGIFIYDLDDLQQAVSSHVADRRKEAELAEAIITGEVERFEARLQTLDVVPTIVSLQDHLETIRQAEIDRVRGRMGRLTPEQEMAIEALTRGIINKVMHTPITTLKTAAKESRPRRSSAWSAACSTCPRKRKSPHPSLRRKKQKKQKWGRIRDTRSNAAGPAGLSVWHFAQERGIIGREDAMDPAEQIDGTRCPGWRSNRLCRAARPDCGELEGRFARLWAILLMA